MQKTMELIATPEEISDESRAVSRAEKGKRQSDEAVRSKWSIQTERRNAAGFLKMLVAPAAGDQLWENRFGAARE